jgi:F-type H+-transporting ATPase subunit epsilon
VHPSEVAVTSEWREHVKSCILLRREGETLVGVAREWTPGLQSTWIKGLADQIDVSNREDIGMPTFEVSLVCPEAQVFVGHADQVDLPGVEGDFGVLAGHAPIVTALRPGIVRVIVQGRDEKFVILGGIAEFSVSSLNILADSASPIEEFDVAGLKAKIEDMELTVPTRPVSDELDREIQRLDEYRTLHRSITVTTAL